MKLFRTLSLLLVALAGAAFGQTALTQTTLSTSVTSSQTTFKLASATGVTANTTLLYVDHEAMIVGSISSTTVHVQRGASGTRASAHVSGAGVLLGPISAFVSVDPQGSCTAGQGVFLYSPVVNVTNSLQWLCSINGEVAPGFGNNSAFANSTTAVASVAGSITPTGPLFHITGALAITGVTLPVGLDPKAGSQFCAIPDGAYTTTTAGNISHASTGVVGAVMCFTYDPNAAKPFSPSY